MKVVQINETCGVGSTGKIAEAISKELNAENIENRIFYTSRGNGCENGVSFADRRYIKLQALKSRIFGNYGFNSRRSTSKMVAELEKIKPDIVHLHNLHGHGTNLEILFDYLAKNRIKTVWTFHDCWALTGYCPHFAAIDCRKWESGCENCPSKKTYSWLFDRSAELQRRKKDLFSSVDLTVAVPSKWLANVVKRSFLKDCDVKIINNGIDLSVFRPTNGDFRKKHGIAESDFLILGVSDIWSEKKGSDVFSALSEKLGDGYKTVVVGSGSENVGGKVISLPRTQSREELAEIYSAADLFVNPTLEETFPTVNIEALACGTPVLTYLTGGSGEIPDDSCGVGVKTGDFEALKTEIMRISAERPYSSDSCVARAKRFDADGKYKEYVSLYRSLLR